MDSYVIKCCNTPCGDFFVRCKVTDQNFVVPGSLYDPGDRCEALHNLFSFEIFPLLQFLESRIVSHFEINNSNLQFCVTTNRGSFKNVCLSQVVDIVLKSIEGSFDETFIFLLDIDCMKLIDSEGGLFEFPIKQVEFGSQINFSYWYETWSCEDDDEIKVWLIGVESTNLPLGENLSYVQRAAIVSDIISELERCYQIELSQL